MLIQPLNVSEVTMNQAAGLHSCDSGRSMEEEGEEKSLWPSEILWDLSDIWRLFENVEIDLEIISWSSSISLEEKNRKDESKEKHEL